MRSFWLDPYLWVHLAGVAVVPIALEGCLLGFAASNSLLPPWMELLIVGGVGAAPILWMQWQRPFCIYSLMALALKPQKLTEDQRRILRRFKQPLGKGLALATAGLLVVVLWQLYQLAPIAWEASAFVPGGSLGGLLLAAASFLLANLFLQVPVSVAQTMLTDEQTIAATEPYPVNAVARDFTLFGIRVNRILPPLQSAPVLATAAAGNAPETRITQPDRAPKNTKTRFKDPQPAAETAPAQSAATSTQTSAERTKRNLVPVEVIDAEFRELDAEDEWDETIAAGTIAPPMETEVEAATEAETEAEIKAATETAAETPAETIAPQAETAASSESSAEFTAEFAATELQADLEASPAVSTEINSEIISETDSEVNSEIDSEIDSETNSEINSESDAGTIADSASTTAQTALAETSAIPEPVAPPVFEEELLEPVPEPEEQPAAPVSVSRADEMLQMSEMTLIEAEDVSEAAAFDISAVEVVTAEIVEDVSEDGAVPAETIESWLEDDPKP